MELQLVNFLYIIHVANKLLFFLSELVSLWQLVLFNRKAWRKISHWSLPRIIIIHVHGVRLVDALSHLLLLVHSLGVLGLIVVKGLLALWVWVGLYPGLILHSHWPVDLLKQRFNHVLRCYLELHIVLVHVHVHVLRSYLDPSGLALIYLLVALVLLVNSLKFF